MWSIKRKGLKWEYVCANTAYGLIFGYAWTKKGAKKKLIQAERELYSER